MWVAGRRGDEIVINDKAVMLSDVWQLVESVPECCDGIFQIVRFAPEMNRLRVRVGYAPDRTGDLNELGSRAAKVLEGGLGVGADVELITCDELLNRSSSVAKLPRVVKA